MNYLCSSSISQMLTTMKSQQDLATAKLEKEKVGKLLLHYSIPAIIGTVVTSQFVIKMAMSL